MKKTFSVLAALVVFILFSFTQEKEYKVKLTEGEIIMLYQTLEVSKAAIPTSTIPFNTGVQALKSIDSLQTILKREYQLQKDTAKVK